MSEMIPLDEICTDFNSRSNLDVFELAKDIRANGLTQPVTVRPWSNKYQLVTGYCRYRAHIVNSIYSDCPRNEEGKPTIKAIVILDKD